MKTHDPNSEKFTSPDLKLRDSDTVWGPLHLSIHAHRAGAELGYEAGEVAYRQEACSPEEAMGRYLCAPRHRPRICTSRIVAEWKALFVLGWTNQLLQDLTRRESDRAERSSAWQENVASWDIDGSFQIEQTEAFDNTSYARRQERSYDSRRS